MPTRIINNFSRGMTSEVRTDDTRYAQLIRNFDAHTFSRKLVPHASFAEGDTDSATNKIKNFAVARYSDGSYRLYGLGVSGTKAKVFITDFVSTTWSALSKGTASSHTAVDPELFVYYAKTGRIYGAADGTTIWSCDPADSVDFDETDGNDVYAHTLVTSYASPRSAAAANRPYITGLVHSKDDVMYIAYDNIIISNSGTGDWTDPALTLPTNTIITSICEYGNYLAIAVKSKDGVGGSQVYLWDRDSTVNDLSEKIDWGEGNLEILKEIGGVLVGVSTSGTAATVLLTRVTFRYYAGGNPVVFNKMVSEDVYVLSDISRASRKVNDYLYFWMSLKLGGTKLEGVWKVGKHVQTGEMLVSMDFSPNNDTALSSGEFHNFIILGDTIYNSFTTGGAVEMTFRSGLSSTYTYNSIYETIKLSEGDISTTKKLQGITVMFEPLPTAGTVTLKYKKDEETSWTTIINAFGTDDAERASAINIQSSGAVLPQYKEIQFQIISTGGAVITGLKWDSVITKKDPYDE